MNLKLIADSPYPKFEVYDEDKIVMRIKIDPQLQAVRLSRGENHRVFFIGEERLRKRSVITLLNEYSQPLGTLINDKSNNTGIVEVEDIKFKFSIAARAGKEISLFEADNLFPVLNCKIENEALPSTLDNITYLLFSLSWYTFLTKKKEDFQFA
jgi:hypothetical protein